ncbi:hypothetical protein MAR_027574 [Mya arenaria]|uniref:Uncharacterized protein n=1 Tax=Mya arenaria TaxID=6604 RepID=A0ABY7EWA4_MYAAR|nr:hypothetical protein MAR_027574 [Mya arenaria]
MVLVMFVYKFCGYLRHRNDLRLTLSLIIDQELKTDRMTSTKREVSQDVKSQVQELVLHDSGKLTFPLRVVKDTTFYSKDYERHTKRICNYVLVQLNGKIRVAVVDHFIYHQDKNVCFAVIRKVPMYEQKPLVHSFVHHLLKVNSEPDSVKHVVIVEQLLEKLLVLNGN